LKFLEQNIITQPDLNPVKNVKKNQKHFMKWKKKIFVPDGQLSFYFPKYTIKEVQFYITDIVFHQINEMKTKKAKRTSWSNLNEIVNDKIQKELEILEKRKKTKL